LEYSLESVGDSMKAWRKFSASATSGAYLNSVALARRQPCSNASLQLPFRGRMPMSVFEVSK
jgi:hypothetical protein